jgi:hypothetical protein
VWPDFQQWHRQPAAKVDFHQSILLLAMERGHLYRVTSAVHRYLIAAGLPRPDVRQQYLQDLRERWMLYSDPHERHQKSRMFLGRLVELQFAEWLELQGWTISGLEALRQGPDIEAHRGGDRVTAFEVKYIGVEDADFATVLRSLAGQDAGGPVSPYAAPNYRLLRVYNAAKQLQKTTYGRTAVLVVDALTWYRFEPPLRANWINWANPTFLSADATWEAFLVRQPEYPDLLADLRPALQSLDAVWILRRSDGYQYHREVEIPIGGA